MPVYEKIHAVLSALNKRGISKNHKNQAQNYSFRGIEDVYQALSELLAEHKLVILPQCEDRQQEQYESSKGSTMFKTVLRVNYLFVDPEDGTTAYATVFAEGCDSGDKSTNKAMSTAYKYMAFQSFCIPVEGEGETDTENQSHDLQPKQQAKREPAAAIGECPQCGKVESVINDRYEQGMRVCYKAKGGCGAKF